MTTDLASPTDSPETLHNRAMEALTGGGAETGQPSSITGPGGGGKFTPEGAVLPWPGNTFIFHIDKASPAYSALCQVQDALMAQPLASHFTYLPQPSFHMTVFSGVGGEPLDPDDWPEGVEKGLPLAEVTRIFIERLAGFSAPAGLRISLPHLHAGYSMMVRPEGAEAEERLRRLRAQLRELTGLSRADHDGYRFHVTLAYRLRFMTKEQAEEVIRKCAEILAPHREALSDIRLGPVEFCQFEDMHAFKPKALITDGGLVQL
ncbi:DUF1868 domain-containing protein [Roseibium litorale]|uniref:DUF1868 domain-containing protein n=1 Tax=Roseibium litorale TaxID=2803841 RepID=A0ABR9CMB0_9HYPH|nr:DUF1868 domain-containing protein [Roseibium litorale]MBD8891719.1 DUF1868 domain-containing protein [Roseibium litorale]